MVVFAIVSKNCIFIATDNRIQTRNHFEKITIFEKPKKKKNHVMLNRIIE